MKYHCVYTAAEVVWSPWCLFIASVNLKKKKRKKNYILEKTIYSLWGKRQCISDCASTWYAPTGYCKGGMIHWKNKGVKSWPDENISRRYSEDFPCVISVTQVGVGYGSRKTLFWEAQSHPELGAASGAVPCSPQLLQTPQSLRKLFLSLALVLYFEKGLLVSAQVSFLFWESYSLKNSSIFFPWKGNLDTVQPRIDIINNNLFWGNKSHCLISFFPLKYFVSVEYI